MPQGFIEPALVVQARSGNPRARANLLEQSRDRLIRAAIHKTLGNVDDDTVKDLIQDVNLKILEGLNSFNDPRAFPNWVYQITRNHCLESVRSQREQVTDAADTEEELLEFSQGAPFHAAEAAFAVREMVEKIKRSLTEEEWYVLEERLAHDTPLEKLLAQTEWEKTKLYDTLQQAKLHALLQTSMRERAEGEYRAAERKLLTLLAAPGLQKRKLRNPLKEVKAKVLTELANIRMDYLKVDGSEGAIDLLHQARVLWSELKDHPNAVYVTRLIGASYYAARRFSDALHHYRLTEEMIQASPHGLNRQRGLLLSNLGNLYRQSGEQETAEKFLVQSVHYHEHQDGEEDYREAQLTLARNLILQGKYEAAAKLFDEARKGVPPYRVGYHVGIKKGLCELSLAMGDYPTGVTFARQGLKISQEQGFYHHAVQFYRYLKRYNQLAAVPPSLLTFITNSDSLLVARGD